MTVCFSLPMYAPYYAETGLVFFCQAEDGIRYRNVTGVQTCALPISTEQIRDQWPNACVLMLTGSNSRSDVDRAREAGAAGYVTKERIAAELIDAILEIGSR